MKMKSILLVTFLMIVTSEAYSQTQIQRGSKLFTVFLGNMEKWKAAYNGVDAQNLAPFYAEDAVYSSSHVAGLEAISRDKVIANFQDGMKMGGHIDKIEILSANSSGNMAALYCLYQATNSGVSVTGRNLLILRKVKGQWLIVNHMTVV